jgi:hypothetical protein
MFTCLLTLLAYHAAMPTTPRTCADAVCDVVTAHAGSCSGPNLLQLTYQAESAAVGCGLQHRWYDAGVTVQGVL